MGSRADSILSITTRGRSAFMGGSGVAGGLVALVQSWSTRGPIRCGGVRKSEPERELQDRDLVATCSEARSRSATATPPFFRAISPLDQGIGRSNSTMPLWGEVFPTQAQAVLQAAARHYRGVGLAASNQGLENAPVSSPRNGNGGQPHQGRLSGLPLLALGPPAAPAAEKPSSSRPVAEGSDAAAQLSRIGVESLRCL